MEYQAVQIQNSIQGNDSAANDAALLALSNERIIGARSFEYNNALVLGVITTPFYLKSERDSFIKELAKNISERTKKDVLVTLDLDIYCKISDEMSNEIKGSLYKKVTQRT